MPPEPTGFLRNAQKFRITGKARVTRIDLEDNVTTVPKLMAAMVEALEGYMSVTSSVVLWTQDFQIQEGYDFVTDSVILRADGAGYFDAECDGHTEVIDLTPSQELYDEGEGCPADSIRQHQQP